MQTVIPSLTSELPDVLERARRFHNLALQTVPDHFVMDSTRKVLFTAYFAVAEELHSSIERLLREGGGCDAGAFTLLRPLLDVSVRAQWMFFCASEENVSRAHAGDDIFPGFPAMLEAIERFSGKPLYRGWKGALKHLHGLTHGGHEQLTRRFNPDTGHVKASFRDYEKRELMLAATLQFELLAHLFCKVHHNGPPKTAAAAYEVSHAFACLFPQRLFDKVTSDRKRDSDSSSRP